jgi:hypothetical protein
MKKFRLQRRSIVDETFYVVAEDEDAALEIARNGGAVQDPDDTEWVDWYEEDYEITKTEELDPLYVMVKQYEQIG